jgi:glycosyltransferase involved in cell wall biosynthesis
VKIAIVAPCPVPYAVGGAEKLWWGLLRHINATTSHQADIIKVPTNEVGCQGIVRGYEAFSQLELGGFDCVLSTKYPAWMVRHPRHAVYLQHRLRGLYDTYPAGMSTRTASDLPPELTDLLALLDRRAGDSRALPEIFERVRALHMADPRVRDACVLPGPFLRTLVRFLDDVALAPDSIARYSAISRTVANRADYFPAGAAVGVAHHPSNLILQPGKRFEYFFTASRLDGPKRVALVVEAMRLVKGDIELWVAGTGPEDARLRALAADDPRIRFLGFVSDSELVDLYRDALAVPFVPYQEDYGLITVEAMQAGKPVITTTDSGGATELVRDGENGYVVAPGAEAIAGAMQRLAGDVELARRLGAAGQQRAASITWESVLETALPEPAARVAAVAVPARNARMRKLVVTTTFPIWPPRFGGQSRVFHLYRELAREFEIVIVALADSSLTRAETQMAPGLREVRIPKSKQHSAREAAIGALFEMPVSDIVAPELYHLTPDYVDALAREAQDATAFVACHPYLYPAIEAVAAGRPVYYEAQDIECQLKQEVLPERPQKAAWIAKVRAVEQRCCTAAQWIFACSDEDAETLQREFGVLRERILIAPNGTDSSAIPLTRRADKLEHKRKLGAAGVPLVLFMGSGHPPNIDAVRQLFTMAIQLPEIVFIILGNVGGAFDAFAAPRNVWLLGESSETARQIIFEAADIALNPMRTGSGTNLKMLDYFAAGLPVISTAIGARGLPVRDGEHLLIRELDDFPAAITGLLRDEIRMDAMAAAARVLVDHDYNWRAIGASLLARLQPAEAIP